MSRNTLKNSSCNNPQLSIPCLNRWIDAMHFSLKNITIKVNRQTTLTLIGELLNF